MSGKSERGVRLSTIAIVILCIVIAVESGWIINGIVANKKYKPDTSNPVIDEEIKNSFDATLSEGNIEVWFQPVMNPVTGDTVGAEALSRWKKGDEIVKSLISMTEDLGIRIIAEGVETEEQVAYLRDAGFDALQGYYYSKPLPEAEFLEYLGQ